MRKDITGNSVKINAPPPSLHFVPTKWWITTERISLALENYTCPSRSRQTPARVETRSPRSLRCQASPAFDFVQLSKPRPHFPPRWKYLVALRSVPTSPHLHRVFVHVSFPRFIVSYPISFSPFSFLPWTNGSAIISLPLCPVKPVSPKLEILEN